MGAIINAANCSVAPMADGGFSVVKTGGVNGAFDASAVSAAGLAGDAVLRVKPLGPLIIYVGLSPTPLAGNDAASIPRAVQVNNGVGRAFESGVLRPGLFTVDTYVWMWRRGGLVQYLTGPDLATAALKRSVADAGAPLFFDSSIAATGAGFEARFGAPAEFLRRRRRAVRLGLGLGF